MNITGTSAKICICDEGYQDPPTQVYFLKEFTEIKLGY